MISTTSWSRYIVYHDRIRLIEELLPFIIIFTWKIIIITMSIYRLFSLLKLSIWIIVLISLYLLINPFSDPIIALSWVLLGVFLIAWWGSYFLFRGRHIYIRKKDYNTTRVQSYKLSLLFALYVLLNVVFLLKKQRSFWLGVLVFIGFIILQIHILPPMQDNESDYIR